MRITIIGVGAMGSLLAARLAHLAEITMLGSWKAQIEILNRKGITLIHPDGHQSQHPQKATDDPTEIAAAELVLILVKTPQTAAAASKAASFLGPNGLAITLQNGLGNLDTIANIVGSKRAAQGVTSEGAAMVRPGVVRHAGAGQTHIAESISGEETADESRISKLKAVVELFNEAGFETRLVENADRLIWGKLAVNAGINPLTALLQVSNGFLLENEDAYWLMSKAASEAAAVAEALEIPLPFPDAVERAVQVAQATAANRSSMAQDVARGVPTEIKAICGEIVRYGSQFNIPTPVNQALLELIEYQTMTGEWRNALERQPDFVRNRLHRLMIETATAG